MMKNETQLLTAVTASPDTAGSNHQQVLVQQQCKIVIMNILLLALGGRKATDACLLPVDTI